MGQRCIQSDDIRFSRIATSITALDNGSLHLTACRRSYPCPGSASAGRERPRSVAKKIDTSLLCPRFAAMALSKPVTPALGQESASRACPAACGALIAARDAHPFCVVCMGYRHAQEALSNPENCSKCLALPKKLLRRRLKVASTMGADEQAWSDAEADDDETDALDTIQGSAPLSWADRSEPPDTPGANADPPPPSQRELPEEDGDEEYMEESEGSEEEDAMPPSQATPSSLPHSVLFEVCERAAARLNIEWPALINPADHERDVYDGKLLGLPPGPKKQLLPVLPACAKHMKHYWEDPLNLKHGLTGLEVKDMSALGMGDAPAVEPSIARHLSPTQGGLLAPPRPVLPNKMDRFSASIFQSSYKANSLAVRALNVSSLLSAYQAELMEDMGKMLANGNATPNLWKEIVTVNDLVLRNARQAVQSCGRSMPLAVVGERALWLNLSGLPDSEKRRIAGAPVGPGQALFGPAVALMQERCDDKKKEDEAFKLCLPRKVVARPPPLPRPSLPPANRPHQPANRPNKPRGKQPGQQQHQQPQQQAKPWVKASFTAAAGKKPAPSAEHKRKRSA